jgi:hypothetical protein
MNKHTLSTLAGVLLAFNLNLTLAQTPVETTGSSNLVSPPTVVALPTASALSPGASAGAEIAGPLPSEAAATAPPESLVPLLPLVTASPGPAPVLVGCRPLTDQAMAMDLSAVTAQSKKVDLATQAKLFGDAIALWSQAAQQCDGRAKERAQRNRDDDQQLLDRVTEKMDSGPQCAAAHKDASSLQDIARQALAERRWLEAANLFRKAENMWDDASERCTGTQQTDANQRRDQSAQDGHNAAHCAPLFEKAREQTQKLRSTAAGMSKEDKQDAQMVAETLWREALGQCKGSAVKDIATNNAQTLARERGTPWVPRLAPAALEATASLGVPLTKGRPTASEPASIGQAAVNKTTALAVSASGQATLPAPLSLPVATLAQTPSKPESKSFYFGNNAPAEPARLALVPATIIATPVVQVPGDMVAGTTRFVGMFARDADSTMVSGNGRVLWESGDVFEGTMVKGLRTGKGTFTWANGQRYEGDWVGDKPTGRATVHFTNGNDYDGPVVDAVPQGIGRMRYPSGDTFEGYFKAGEPDQTGVYVWRNGQRYDGSWKNGRPEGQGKLKFATGNLYEGMVVGGVPHGQGRMVFAGGEVYTGQFQTGEPDGEGTFDWPSGDKYVGQWKKGKKHGKGVFTWKSGDRWEGLYEEDVQKN